MLLAGLLIVNEKVFMDQVQLRFIWPVVLIVIVAFVMMIGIIGGFIDPKSLMIWWMKKLFAFVLGLLLFLCPFAVQAEDFELILQEEIAEVPSKDALNYLLNEDMYQGTSSWQGNKSSTKFNYDKPKKK